MPDDNTAMAESDMLQAQVIDRRLLSGLVMLGEETR